MPALQAAMSLRLRPSAAAVPQRSHAASAASAHPPRTACAGRPRQHRRAVAAAAVVAAAAAGSSPDPPPPAASKEDQPPLIDVTYESLDKVGLPEQGMDPKVAEALQRVQAALAEAEQSMQTLDRLPSARLPNALDRVAGVLRPAAQFASLMAVCAAVHSLGTVGSVVGSLMVALGAGWWGWRRTSLDGSGAIAAVLVGWGTLASSFRSGFLLLTFFFASSKLTQFGEELKDVDEEHKKGGQRDWRQVFCNALVPTGIALAAAFYGGGPADLALWQVPAGVDAATAQLLTALAGAFLGYYACCCGDTWASELGQLSPEEPRLITTLRPVRKGTNGGVTLLGLAASLAGGLAMGLTFWLATIVSPHGAGRLAARQWQLAALGVAAGLVGSLIDSLLGATIQFTGYNRVTGKITGRPGPDVSHISGFPVLDNNMVNAVSASLTAALAGLAAAALA